MLPLEVLMDSSGPPPLMVPASRVLLWNPCTLTGSSTVISPLLVLAFKVALRSVGTDRSIRELLVLIVHPEDMLDPDSARAVTGPLLELMSSESNRPVTWILPLLV